MIVMLILCGCIIEPLEDGELLPPKGRGLLAKKYDKKKVA